MTRDTSQTCVSKQTVEVKWVEGTASKPVFSTVVSNSTCCKDLSKTLTLEPRPSQNCDFIIDSIWKWYLLQWLGLLGWCVDKLKYVDFTSSFCEDFKFDPTLKPLFIPTRFPPQPYLTPSLIPVFRVSWREDWSTSLSNKQTSSTRNHFSSASTDSKAPEPWQNKEKRRSIWSGMFPILWSLKPLSVFFFLKSF